MDKIFWYKMNKQLIKPLISPNLRKDSYMGQMLDKDTYLLKAWYVHCYKIYQGKNNID